MLLQFPGGSCLGDTLGVDVDDPGGGTEYFAKFPEFFPEDPLSLINPLLFFGAAFKQMSHRHIPELTVEGEFQKGTQIVPGPGKAVGTVLVVAEGIPGGVLGKPVMGINALDFHCQIREQLLTPADGFPQIHLNFVTEGQFSLLQIVSGRAVVQKQWSVHRHPVPENPGHGHAASGVDGEDTVIFDEVITVTTEQAYETGRLLGRTEGILCGISSGAALMAAIEVAKREENAGKTIIVILPDSGDRYLSTEMF